MAPRSDITYVCQNVGLVAFFLLLQLLLFYVYVWGEVFQVFLFYFGGEIENLALAIHFFLLLFLLLLLLLLLLLVPLNWPETRAE